MESGTGRNIEAVKTGTQYYTNKLEKNLQVLENSTGEHIEDITNGVETYTRELEAKLRVLVQDGEMM